MSEINLLPEEHKPKGYALKVSHAFRKVQLLLFSILLLTIIMIAAANIILTVQNNKLVNKSEELKQEVQALTQTEQKLILFEDRVKKIKSIESGSKTYEKAQAIQNIILEIPAEVTLKSYVIDDDASVLTVTSTSSSDLTKYFSYILNSGSKTVKLNSFRYENGEGYEISLAVSS